MNPAEIVLIEDNPADVFLVELAMKENGIPYHLTRFASGEEAVKSLCELSSGDITIPDAILLDLNTPRSDGFQVLGRLKNTPRLARVPLAIITSSCANSDKFRAKMFGTRHIEKPARLNEFLSTVGGAIREMLANHA